MAKNLTTPEVAERVMRQALDEDYYSHIRKLVRFTLGEKYIASGAALSSALSGDLQDDVDLLPKYYEPGQSRRILTNAFLMAAKVCYTTPDPDYPDKDRWKEVVTKAFNKALWMGRPWLGPTKFQEFGEWSAEAHRMFLDADGLGIGFLQIGIRDGWTTVQHHPLGRVIWDRHRFNATRSRFIGFMHHLPEEEAVAMFGSDILKDVTSDTTRANGMRVIKALQYFDMGLGTGTPTEMWRLGNLAGKILDISENEYGCLPFAHQEHIHFYGMRRPVGRIDFQIADQQMRNAYERYQRLVLERGPGFDAVDTGKINPDDQQALEEGELMPVLRFEVPADGKVGNYIQRFSAQEVPMSVLRGLEQLDRSDPGNSGISDADRANVTSSPHTLGEIENVQAGADTQKEWSQRQYAAALQRLFYRVNYIASKLHTAPTPLSINGLPFLLNEPGNPRSNIAYWLNPASWPLINEDALVRSAPLRRMQIAQGKWSQFLNDPYMNPVEVRRAILQEYGEKDIDRFINPSAVAQMGGGSGMGPAAPPQAPGLMGPMPQGSPSEQPAA